MQVFNRLSDQVYADAAGSYCPFTAVDLWGSTIDLSGWNGGMHEVLCCTLNATAIAAGTWTQKLYRDNVKIFEWSMEAPSWWECMYWFIGNGELSKNGNYRWEIWGVGNLLQTYNFTVINSPEDRGEAEGEIITHFINGLPCPDCGEAKEGQEIEVIMGMKNIGGVEGEFRFYIHDQYGNELSKEPDFTYKNVKAGNTWEVHKTLTTNLNFKMLNEVLNGRVELRRQT